MSPCGSQWLAKQHQQDSTGIDGCRSGWISFSARQGFQRFDSLKKLVARCDGDLYIDVPMGLTSSAPRELESLARRQLKGKSASIFNVPSREAVYAADYIEACDLNAARFGKKLSKQSWFIVPKIRQADELLAEQPALAARLFESHPELSFFRLGGFLSSKKTATGLAERIELLATYIDDAETHFEAALKQWTRQAVAKDDLLDAMVLSLLGQLKVETLSSAHQSTDETSIPIRMVIPAAI